MMHHVPDAISSAQVVTEVYTGPHRQATDPRCGRWAHAPSSVTEQRPRPRLLDSIMENSMLHHAGQTGAAHSGLCSHHHHAGLLKQRVPAYKRCRAL